MTTVTDKVRFIFPYGVMFTRSSNTLKFPWKQTSLKSTQFDELTYVRMGNKIVCPTLHRSQCRERDKVPGVVGSGCTFLEPIRWTNCLVGHLEETWINRRFYVWLPTRRYISAARPYNYWLSQPYGSVPWFHPSSVAQVLMPRYVIYEKNSL